MKLYLNASLNTFIIPIEVLESLGKPYYFHLCYDSRNKIIFIVPDKQFTQDSFDVPKIFYTKVWKGIRIFGRDFGRKICKDMKFTIFAKKTVREYRIPFEIGAENLNAETIAAIKEVQELKKDPNKKKYSSFAEILEDLDE